MKKVAFSISNVRSKSDKKLSGFGYLAEGNLLCPCISKNSKPYIRIFNDVEKHCRPVNGKKDEFQDYANIPMINKFRLVKRFFLRFNVLGKTLIYPQYYWKVSIALRGCLEKIFIVLLL